MSLQGNAVVDANGGATVVLKNDSPVQGQLVTAVHVRVPEDESPGTCKLFSGPAGGDSIAISANGRYDDANGQYWLGPGGYLTVVWTGQTVGLQAEAWLTASPADKGPTQAGLSFTSPGGGGKGGGEWNPRLSLDTSISSFALTTLLTNDTKDRVFEFQVLTMTMDFVSGFNTYISDVLLDTIEPSGAFSNPLFHWSWPLPNEMFTYNYSFLIPPGWNLTANVINDNAAGFTVGVVGVYTSRPYREAA